MRNPTKLATRIATATDVVYATDPWSRAQFGDEATGGGALTAAIEQRAEAQWPGFTREVFSRLYEPATTTRLDAPDPSASWATTLHDESGSLPEWQDAALAARRDPWLAGLGAAAVAQVLAHKLPPLPEEQTPLEEELERREEEAGDEPSAKQQAAIDALKERIEQAQAQAQAAQDVTGKGALMRSLMRGALRQATEEMHEAGEGMATLSACAGTESGELRKDPQLRARLANPTLKRILQLAGRLKATAATKQATRCNTARDEIHSIESGADIARLLPSELLGLADEDLWLVLAARILDRSCLQYQLRGTEKAERGPIVFCVDESGSMTTQCGAYSRNEWAKACLLALAFVAAKQRRAFVVVHFDAEVHRVATFAAKERWSAVRLLEECQFFSGGGTNIAEALIAARRVIETSAEMRKADVVLLTDGETSGVVAGALPPDLAALYTVLIGTGYVPDDVRSASTAVAVLDAQIADGKGAVLAPIFGM